MKLTIASKPVYLPVEAKISIEKSSPCLNEDTGSFSYPFPVPTLPNQQLLGWPGKLQRSGDIPDQTFILEEGGLQVFGGEVEYDTVTKNEIGVILKSGRTLFRSKIEGKQLNEMEFGSETWLPKYYLSFDVWDKIKDWDNANTTNNDKYVCAPAIINPIHQDIPLYVNCIMHTTGKLDYDMQYRIQHQLFMLQFRAYFILEKIFETNGYTVILDELKTSEFNKLVVFSKIINIPGCFGPADSVKTALHYSSLMPEITVIDFMDNIANLLALVFDVDERKKKARIYFKKNIFAVNNVNPLNIVELAGWIHSEQKSAGGFKLCYKDQDDELDTYTDYPPFVNLYSTLPAPVKEDEIIQLPYNRLYICVKVEGVLTWKLVGRLREVLIGNGSEKVELAVKIPRAVSHPDGYVFPKLEFTPTPETQTSMINRIELPAITELIVSLYHGRVDVNGIGIPYTSGDQWGITDGWAYGAATHLSPIELYNKLYTEFLNWKGYRARSFTKYIQLTLPQVLALRWDTRYAVDGITFILDKINFDLPFQGTVKITGYTV
jgi:hypothetical protein